ncbi:unnamed protein product [Closterium sp. NIES-54]
MFISVLHSFTPCHPYARELQQRGQLCLRYVATRANTADVFTKALQPSGSGGAEPGGAEPGGTEPAGAEPEGAEPGGAESEGAESGGAERRATGGGDFATGGTGAGGAGATSPGGAGVLAGAGGPGGARAGRLGGARTSGTGVAGAGGAEGARDGDPSAGGAGASGTGAVDLGARGSGAAGAGGVGGAGAGGFGAGGTEAGGAGAGGAGAGGGGAGDLGVGGAGAVDPGAGGAGAGGAASGVLSRPASLVRVVRTGRRIPRPRSPPVPSTHFMALRPSSVPLRVPLPPPPESSLPAVPDPEPYLARAATPTVTRLLATVVTGPSFESSTASDQVAELVDFAAACRLDYATSLVAESESDCPPSVKGECALGTDVLEDRQEDFECLAVVVPHLVAMLLAPEGDPDAQDILTPRTGRPGRHRPEHWEAAKRVSLLVQYVGHGARAWRTGSSCPHWESDLVLLQVLYVDNKAMIALCQEHRLEHITKHIALRYFLARELQQRGQLRLAYVATRANAADIFTKALQSGDH